METQSEPVVTVDEGVGAPIPEAAEPAAQPETPAGPPAGYENVPPELWPDKDGNPPRMTEALMRQLRGKYFTVRHVKMSCGHKLDQINQPKNNCHECWAAFFGTHPQLVEIAHQFYQTQGRGPIVAMRGEKFVKFFEKFMAMMYAEMRRRKEEEERNGVGNSESGSTGRNSQPSETPTAPEIGEGSGNQGSGSRVGEAV